MTEIVNREEYFKVVKGEYFKEVKDKSSAFIRQCIEILEKRDHREAFAEYLMDYLTKILHVTRPSMHRVCNAYNAFYQYQPEDEQTLLVIDKYTDDFRAFIGEVTEEEGGDGKPTVQITPNGEVAIIRFWADNKWCVIDDCPIRAINFVKWKLNISKPSEEDRQ